MTFQNSCRDFTFDRPNPQDERGRRIHTSGERRPDRSVACDHWPARFAPARPSTTNMAYMWKDQIVLLLIFLLAHDAEAVKITIRKPTAKRASQPAISTSTEGRTLMVVGAGALGRRVAELWKEHEGADVPVYAITRTPDEQRDTQLRAKGITPMLRAQLASLPSIPHVVFCAPPGIKFDAASLLLYPGTISSALGRWDNEADGASFVFTSSAGVYAEQNGGVVTEESPAAETLRAERLLAAERLVAECGGTVLRLAGLYDQERGAHQIYMGRPRWPADPHGLINQLHYGARTGPPSALPFHSRPPALRLEPLLAHRCISPTVLRTHRTPAHPLTRTPRARARPIRRRRRPRGCPSAAAALLRSDLPDRGRPPDGSLGDL